MTDEQTLSETNILSAVQTEGTRTNIVLDSQILTTLMSCPRLSDFRFNHNLMSISGKSNSLEVGSIVHKFLETYYKCITQKLSKKQAEGFAFASAELYISGCKSCSNFVADENQSKPSCGHTVDEYPGVMNTPKDSSGYIIGWQYALDTCAQYLQYYQNDAWEPIEVEKVRQALVYSDDEIRIIWKAKYDWIGNTLQEQSIPMDHKTMKQNRTTVSLNNQFIGQCLLLGSNKVFINKIGFQKTLPANEKFKRDAVNYNSARIMEWQSEILPYWAKLLLMYSRTGYFPPNYTHCENKYGMCAFKEVCEADQSDRERILKLSFRIGKVWNPTNDEE